MVEIARCSCSKLLGCVVGWLWLLLLLWLLFSSFVVAAVVDDVVVLLFVVLLLLLLLLLLLFSYCVHACFIVAAVVAYCCYCSFGVYFS